MKEKKKRMQQELQDKYQEKARRVGTSSPVDEMLVSTGLPYSVIVMAMPLLPKFKISQIDLQDGSKDPLKHLDTFMAHMTLHRFPREVACRAFPLTLKGATQAQFTSLAPNLVHHFDYLSQLFLLQFLASSQRRRPTTYLLIVKQQENESLKSYLFKFNKECMTADDLDQKKKSRLQPSWEAFGLEVHSWQSRHVEFLKR